jgi:hypothetical protein
MNMHFDVTLIPLIAVAIAYVVGVVAFETAVIVMLAMGLPYGGPSK